ncbi:hypothetical protein D9615_003390 [Tricholomella constricta]|uniref:Uncharacterized protein n=1 Tax=Tricholomella constricta TaxID=117010 RepID=A0A8H5HJ86_9AGAR|nr:hypothetical protein D9615_003390 [Tricholomella constricta]
MKTSTIAPAIIACLMSVLTSAGPIPISNQLASRGVTNAGVDVLYIRDIEAEIMARAAELEARGGGSSKEKKKDSKASYPVGDNKPETPTGEFRKFTAGRDDDYFADWQTMTGGKGKSGVNNPAAGKGKKKGKRDLFETELEARGGGSSKEKKKDSKASYPVGDNKPETPTGEFRKFTAGRDDDYFGDWQTMTGGKGKSGVDNPAAGKGKKKGKRDLFETGLEARGGGSSKEKKKDSKASYPVGDNKPETPTGEFRKFTAGRDDDYFADWQTMTSGKGKSGVDNPAAGKGKKKGKRDLFETGLEARGGGSSKEKKKDSKASYPVGDNKPETPTGEFRKFTAGRDDDYFADWQTMTGGKGKSGVNNPAAGKGKKKGKRDLFETELEARGGGSSKEKKKDSKASYPVGDNKPETPTGEFRKFTAGRDDDYFGDWQTMTGGKGKSGVNNPAAGKGKKKGKRDLFETELEARGGGSSKEKKKDSKASYPVGDNKPETPTGEFRKFTAGRDDDYFGDWQTMTGGKGKSGVDNPAAGKGKKKQKRDFFDSELELS